MNTSEDHTLEGMIKLAKDGNVVTAKTILRLASDMLIEASPLPEPLNNYLSNCLLDISQGEDPNSVFYLRNKKRGPKEDIGHKITIAVRYSILLKNDVKPYKAQCLLAAEYGKKDPARIQKIFKEHEQYVEWFLAGLGQKPSDPLLDKQIWQSCFLFCHIILMATCCNLIDTIAELQTNGERQCSFLRNFKTQPISPLPICALFSNAAI